MSEAERPDRLSREVTVEDIRALVGPATPHFALQIRNRIRRLVDPLPPEHPARVEAEREIPRLKTSRATAASRAVSAPGRTPLAATETGADALDRGRELL